MRGFLFKLSGALLLATSLVVGWFFLDYQSFLETPLNLADSPQEIRIEPGTSVPAIANALRERGLIDKSYLFVWAARLSGTANRLKAGEYLLSPGMTPPELLALLVSGRVIQRAFTIVEGWTFADLRRALSADERITQTLDGVSDEEVMTRIGAPGEHPEGRFLPDTYHFPSGTTDVAFLQRAHAAMKTVLAQEWNARAADLPLKSPAEALVLASIIEKETAVAAERAAIAGVFVRRLQRGMRLETDPTVIYGIGTDFDGNLTRADLRADTPYNTYTRRGLPPTPIALPGRASIHAALHPEEGTALFFVARGDGTHEFSTTYAEHRRAVAKYQLRHRTSTATAQ